MISVNQGNRDSVLESLEKRGAFISFEWGGGGGLQEGGVAAP